MRFAVQKQCLYIIIELKPCLPQVKKSSTHPPLSPLSKGTSCTLNHNTPPPFPQISPGGITPSNITRNGTSKPPQIRFLNSLIEPQLLYCTPACSYKFHALRVHPHHTLTAPSIRGTFGVRSKICGGVFVWEQSTC